MNDSTKKIIYTVLVGLPTLLIVWVFSLYFFGCGTDNTCTGIQLPPMTPIPTLLPATLPAPKVGAEALAASPKCRIAALNLIGAWVEAGYKEKEPFTFTDVKGANCTASFQTDVQKLFVTPNLWYDGASSCTTCHYADVAKAQKNMDLSSYAGILAGSNRLNGAAKGNDILGGGNWNDALLHKMLFAPGGKTEINRPAMPFGRPANVPAEGPVISAGSPAGSETTAAQGSAATPEATAAPTEAAAVEIARPSNPGGPGDAINLKGDAATGGQIFVAQCSACHGDQGKAGILNPGSEDGSVPPLNPIDSTLINTDPTVYATNLDLFIEHGSKPAGEFPVINMPAWGDQKLLAPQEIADVIAYVMGLNNSAAVADGSETTPAAPATTPEVAATSTLAPTEEVARPSNPGGPGEAINLKGDAATGGQIFVAQCSACHGDQGKAGIPNPGSEDGSVPPLNPIDSTLINTDLTVYATNLDLFIEHGSTPAGKSPVISMPPWGDKKLLSPQEIADLIAYLIGLNK